MIGPLDTLTLARTKLRSKRILLTITVIVSGLLFGVLAAGIIVASGVTNSTERFFTKALGGRYFVQTQPNIPDWVYGYDDTYKEPSKELSTKLLAMQDTYIAEQKALHDKHKIPFDKSMVAPILQPSPFGEKDAAGNPKQVINRESPVYQKYAQERIQDYAKTAPNKLDDLKKLAARYGATDYYHNTTTTLGQQAMYLEGGQEKFAQKPFSPNSYDDYLTTNVKQSSYMLTDQDLIQRFILPENDARKKHTDAIPVVLTTQEIAKVFGKELGIDKQPSSPAEQVAWTKDLLQKANGHTYSVCYRSPGERDLIQKTMAMNTEIATKAKDKTYEAPRLQYNLPENPCGELTVKQDKRTAEEKKQAATEETLQKELGTYQPREHTLLTFQIVGAFTLSMPSIQPSDPSAYIAYLLGPQYQTGAFIPEQLYDKLPADTQHKTLLFDTEMPNDMLQGGAKAFEKAGIVPTIVSFPSLEAARDFIKQEACQYAGSDCKKSFAASTYGSAYLAANEISNGIARVGPIALIVATSIAAIVIWITMARVIIDSRRETAVFRALGAKRRDIAAIYLLYSLLVALLIVIFMLVLGIGGATVVHTLLSGDATNIAMIAYGVFDEPQPFSFIGFPIPLLGLLSGCIVAISFVAVLPPLWRNVRRSPIRDMRDE